MPKQYSGMGLSFLYPDSWTATEEGEGQRSAGVILESPGGSFLSIMPLAADLEPEEAVREAAEAMDAEYEDIESEPLTVQIANQDFHGTTQRFYYLDFVIVSKLISMPLEDQLYLVQIQGEDRDMDQQALVFEAILTSMLRSVSQQN
ncbi:MAG: hypothetical protein ACTHK7_22295 [Aureliella sp.]